jgi:5'-3' exonuclease/transcription antitermination factor NusG
LDAKAWEWHITVAEWVVLELTPRSEGENPDLLRRSIRNSLKDPLADVFVPAAITQVGEDRVIHYLVDGYVFVRRTADDAVYFRLEGSRFVQSVLTEMSGKRRKLACVLDGAIERMRSQIRQETDQGIGVGDTVRIISGAYRHIEAKVIEEIPEQEAVQVHVKLRSKESIVTLPRSFLQVIGRTPLSGFFSRLTQLRKWVRFVKPILLQTDKPSTKGLKKAWLRYSGLDNRLRRMRLLWAFVNSYGGYGSTGLAELRPELARVERLTTWGQRLDFLLHLVRAYYDGQLGERFRALQAKMVEVYWFEDVLERLHNIQQEVEVLAHRIAKRTKNGGVQVVQNLLVDGHNLAFRCLYAPGMAELSSEGRPTGMILGFLRSLGSLRKRCPEARLYVTWDGSSQRRKKLFADYKANRPVRVSPSSSGEFDQIGELRALLPMVGIWQATNPEEEADDVIATLVQGKLKGQHNLIYSSDRDLLALVTETTAMLVPGVGSRKEILYDPAMVATVFGVPPSKLLQLRSFCGDSSDNIPGVPRVPKKVLLALIQAYGSIEGVYNSGLTGLTKGQYERLRLAEPQVRLNVELMSPVDIPVSVTNPEPDVEGATQRLQGVGINPTPLLKALLGGGEVTESS